MSAHVYHCTKNSGGFPNTWWKSDTITRQMHAVLVLFRPLPNVDIQKFGMWGMYNLTKAYGNIENPFANRRVEDWEASNGHTKDKTRLFHGPWHNAVGEHICAQAFRMWNRLRFHTFLQVSQIFQRRKSDANGQSAPKTIGTLTKVFYTYGPNLVILARTGYELSRGQACGYRTHRRTHRQTDAGNDNTRRPKLASGNND